MGRIPEASANAVLAGGSNWFSLMSAAMYGQFRQQQLLKIHEMDSGYRTPWKYGGGTPSNETVAAQSCL